MPAFTHNYKLNLGKKKYSDMVLACKKPGGALLEFGKCSRLVRCMQSLPCRKVYIVRNIALSVLQNVNIKI